MFDPELDEEKEENADSGNVGCQNNVPSVLKSNKVSCSVARDKIQKQVANFSFLIGSITAEKAPQAQPEAPGKKPQKIEINKKSAHPDCKAESEEISKNPLLKVNKQEVSNILACLDKGVSTFNRGVDLVYDSFINIKDYGYNLAVESHNSYRQFISDINEFYCKVKGFFSNLYQRIFCSFCNLCNRVSEGISSVIKSIINFLEKSDSSHKPIINNKNLANTFPGSEVAKSSATSANAQISANAFANNLEPEPYLSVIKDDIENLAQALSLKEREQKLLHEQQLIQHQIELVQQADRAYNEALLKRPDLASKLIRPQVAFLASSPFVKLPSADELIEQAEKMFLVH